MANFKTHITGAAAASWVGAVGLHGLGVVPANEITLLTVTGALGGILPDIDSDNSYPLSIIFFFIYLLAGHAILVNGAGHLEFPLLLAACLFTLACIRIIAFPLFLQWTRHRGLLHSILAALLFGLSASAVADQTYDFPAKTAWLLGFFIFYGCIVHLVLDELYSVDFNNKRIKKSSGTALKFWNTKDERGKINSGIFLILTFIAFGFTPDLDALFEMWETSQAGFSELIQALTGPDDVTPTKESN